MNYKLLITGCMVSALDPHGPSPVGVIWKPFDTAELDEAKALRNVGYAEETTAKPTAKTRAELAAEKPKDEDATPNLSGIKEVGILQEDGTFKNKQGVRVHKDGSEFRDGDELRAALEPIYKDRKTVKAALEAALQPKSE